MSDFAKIQAEFEWLKKYPHFEEKPASITEFLGPEYLNLGDGIRPGVRQELVELFGEEVNGDRIAKYKYGMFTGAIGIGKTTMASVILPYMCHWVLCLKDPQGFYSLLPGSRIAFMMMSTSGDQAKETVFGDVKARIQHSPWFSNKYPYDPKFTNQLRFDKNIWVLPGDSRETTFEGYNILGGILDEADSHKITKERDYGEQGWNTINGRIESRYFDEGFLLTVGQMKKASGFAKRKYEEHKRDPKNAHTVRMTIWESLGWDFHKFLKPDGSRDSFWYDISRKEIVPTGAAKLIESGSDNLIEVPNLYRTGFENAPEKALRDLAGIPPAAGDPFISLTHKLEEAVERWEQRHDFLGSPVNDDSTRPQFANWFRAKNSLKRQVHIDIAYSADGDALGLSMGHVSHLVDFEGEERPYIVFDFLMRMKAAPGTEIMLSDVRRIIYHLRDDLGFKIRGVSMDGFQSTDTRQQLQKRRYSTEYVSVDKSKLPYEDLRDAIYEDRIEFPPYFTYVEKGDLTTVQIAIKELSELEDDDKKVDHPASGSKDVADTMAGVVYKLMGDRSFRRGARSSRGPGDRSDDEGSVPASSTDLYGYGPASQSAPGSDLAAPVPFGGAIGTDLSMPLPPSLTPRRGR